MPRRLSTRHQISPQATYWAWGSFCFTRHATGPAEADCQFSSSVSSRPLGGINMRLARFAFPAMLMPGKEPIGDRIVGSSARSAYHDSRPPVGLHCQATREPLHIWPTGIFLANFFSTFADMLSVASGSGDFLD